MNPLLTLALFATEQLIKHAPALFAGFQELVARQDVTVELIQQKRAEIEAQRFTDLVPNSELPEDVKPDAPQAPVG